MKFRHVSGAARVLFGMLVGITLWVNLGPQPAPDVQLVRDSFALREYQDSLRVTRTALRFANVQYATALESYDSARKRVRTKWLTRTDTLTEVDTLWLPRFVAAADSLRDACSLLATDCARFKLAADSTLAARERINASLRAQLERKDNWRTKMPYLGGGIVLGFAACKL